MIAAEGWFLHVWVCERQPGARFVCAAKMRRPACTLRRAPSCSCSDLAVHTTGCAPCRQTSCVHQCWPKPFLGPCYSREVLPIPYTLYPEKIKPLGFCFLSGERQVVTRDF